jgi:hypothetical protein
VRLALAPKVVEVEVGVEEDEVEVVGGAPIKGRSKITIRFMKFANRVLVISKDV